MTFICELDTYPLEILPQTENELSKSSLSKVIVFVLHTNIQTDATKFKVTLPRRFAGDNEIVKERTGQDMLETTGL